MYTDMSRQLFLCSVKPAFTSNEEILFIRWKKVSKITSPDRDNGRVQTGKAARFARQATEPDWLLPGELNQSRSVARRANLTASST